MRHRFNNAFGKELSPYEIIGQPKDLECAKALALESENSGRYQFETWATGLVDAFPLHSNKKGSDKGIDGHINFFDDNSGKAKTIIVQVKSGHVNSSHIRDLKGVLDREKAQIGVYITLEEPTKPMIEEATTAGFYEPEHFPGTYYPRIQILTIQQLLDGKQVQYPRHAPVATFKRAPRAQKANDNEQNQLF
jgi:site-specific DNA-methyltransferase (adenine-specific)